LITNLVVRVKRGERGAKGCELKLLSMQQVELSDNALVVFKRLKPALFGCAVVNRRRDDVPSHVNVRKETAIDGRRRREGEHDGAQHRHLIIELARLLYATWSFSHSVFITRETAISASTLIRTFMSSHWKVVCRQHMPIPKAMLSM
jgi:hypothetical protein